MAEGKQRENTCFQGMTSRCLTPYQRLAAITHLSGQQCVYRLRRRQTDDSLPGMDVFPRLQTASGAAKLRGTAINVCLSVCLSALVSQNPHVHTSRNFLYVLHMAVTRSSPHDIVIRYVLPVWWMTHVFTRWGMRGVQRGSWPKDVSQREATEKWEELQCFNSDPLCVASR